MSFTAIAALRNLFENKYFDWIVLYNVVVYAAMISIYHAIDFDAHFDLKQKSKAPRSTTTTGEIMYFAWMTHTNVMAGEITPKTDVARGLMCVHVLLTWGMVMVLLSPSLLTLSRLVRMK